MLALAPEGGLRRAVGGLGLGSAGFKGWPLAVGGPVAIHLIGLALLVATGLTALEAPQVTGSWGGAGLRILAGLLVGTLFALCEEVGWRGYMLPRMTRDRPRHRDAGRGLPARRLASAVAADDGLLPRRRRSLDRRALFLITLTLAGVFFGFLRVWTGSVWPVAVAHAAVNMAWAISDELTVSRTPLVLEYLGGESGADRHRRPARSPTSS